MIWVIAFWYAVIRYRFLALTPEIVGADIFTQSHDIIALTDVKGNIIYLNAKGEKIIKKNGKKTGHISVIVHEYKIVEKMLSRVTIENDNSINYRMNINVGNDEKILVDAFLKTYFDKFGDKIGILLIGREV